MRFRAVPALAAVLLTAACASGAPVAAPATSAASTPSQAPTPTAATPTPSTLTSPTQEPKLKVAISAVRLPYKPVAGAPKLGDVTVLTSPSDPCAIPADNSGNEGQLLDAQMDGPVLIVTFEFTNPCSRPLSYAFTVTQAIGSATGPSGGAPVETVTRPIAAGKSVQMNINVDPKPSLTSAQLQQLWVGITHITKRPGY